MRDVDYTQRTGAEPDDDPMSDPLMRSLRDLTKYWPMWKDPVAVKQFYDSLQDAMTHGRNEAKGANEEEVWRLRQERPEGDYEYFSPEGANRWNQNRKGL